MQTDLIFENYSGFLNENRDMFQTPRDAMQMLSTDATFYSYVESLTEGMDSSLAATIRAVSERERSVFLEGAANVGPSSSAIGYAVSYFPILADIYASSVITQIATVFPTTKSMITIPRIQVDAVILNPDGTTTSQTLAREDVLARGVSEAITVAPAVSNDLFALSTGAANGMTNVTNRINKRFLNISAINVTDVGMTAIVGLTHDVAVSVRPDSRGHFRKDFTFADADANVVTATIVGDVMFDTGVLQYNVTATSIAAGASYTINHAISNVMFSPVTGDIGRVKVKLTATGWDVNIDVHDDFEIELSTETIQDYRDIYNVDVIRTLSSAIKQQILLNKDFDIAYFLQAAEADMLALGASATVDLALYAAGGGKGFTPESPVDIFKGVLPAIATINNAVRRNHRADPQFLVTGYRAGAMLQSLQSASFNSMDSKNGEFGQSGNSISFRKQTVVTSAAVANDTIYAVYKAPSDDLSRAAIVDLVYQPLYIVTETTNSVQRSFVKSRTAIELARPEAVGVVKLLNAANYLY